MKNQKFIYWVGCLYTQFSFQEEEKTKQFRFIGFASLHITIVLLYIIFVQHYLMCVFLLCGWYMYTDERPNTFSNPKRREKGRHFFSRVITKLWLACVRLFETYILSHTLNYYITFLPLSLFYTHTIIKKKKKKKVCGDVLDILYFFYYVSYAFPNLVFRKIVRDSTSCWM